MENNDLEFIYNQLKDQYDLVLTNAFALDTGFNADINVLSGKSLFGTFYLYKATDPEFIFEVNLSDGTYTHWHPDSKEEALQDVFQSSQRERVQYGFCKVHIRLSFALRVPFRVRQLQQLQQNYCRRCFQTD